MTFKFLKSILLLAIICGNSLSWAAEPDLGIYQALLDKQLSTKNIEDIETTWVDYSALKNEPLLNQSAALIENFDTTKLETLEEKLAFYINAYNIFTLRLMTENWPVKSIKSIGKWYQKVWDLPVGKMNNKQVSLGEIEHKILRKMNEPRIHMAIVCASISCPSLNNTVFTASNLYAELDKQSREFLNKSGKGMLVKNGDLYISKIFDWFEDDFKKGYGSVKSFIEKYSKLPKYNDIEYLNYNWNANGQ